MDIIDLRGKPCPLPVIEMKKLIAASPPGSGLAALVDDDVAAGNLRKLAEGKGCGFAAERRPDGAVLATFTLPASGVRGADAGGGGLVVAIGDECMGRGDDELGRTLMKSFLHSLAELDAPPERALFFNGGVRLTCRGSAALDDIAALAGKGTEIESCGACLDFYQLTESLAVGGITNMAAILDAMAGAARLIRL